MRRRPIGRSRVLVGVLLALALVTACGDTDSTAGGGTGSTGTSTASETTPTGTTTTAKKKKKQNVVAWILGLGPGAPDGPPEFTAYRELKELRCARVFDRVGELDEPARTLYTGAANACLAAFDGRDELWPKSASALAAVIDQVEDLNCMDRAALALLKRLVRLHDERPSRTFRTAAGTKAKAPPCPTIAALDPDTGTEGTLVRMSGRHLGGGDVVGVTVFDSLGNSLPAEGVDVVDGSLQFTMPEEPSSDASASVCIVVRADPDWRADGAMFTYESDTTLPPSSFDCPPPEEG